MAYGDLNTFLPRAEGEVLDVERARSEGASRANYLSEMDQFYEGLQESARQFDVTQSLAERQFDWSSGFEDRRLASETKIAEERMGLEKYLGEMQGDYWKSQAELGKMEVGIREKELEMKGKENEFLQSYYTSQLDMEKTRFGAETQLLMNELYPVKKGYKPGMYGVEQQSYDTNYNDRQSFARTYGIKLNDFGYSGSNQVSGLKK